MKLWQALVALVALVVPLAFVALADNEECFNHVCLRNCSSPGFACLINLTCDADNDCAGAECEYGCYNFTHELVSYSLDVLVAGTDYSDTATDHNGVDINDLLAETGASPEEIKKYIRDLGLEST